MDARFQGTIVRGLGYPICRRSPCGPRRQFDIGDYLCHKQHSQMFGSCIYIFISIIKTIVTIYLNAGRSQYCSIVARLRGFFTDSLSHSVDRLATFPKTEFLFGPHASRYIASRSVRRANRRCSLTSPHVCVPVWA